MGLRVYLIISGVAFGLVALFNICVTNTWEWVLESWSAPVWISWFGISGQLILCVWAIRLARRGDGRTR
ncbi:MAG: hypothetical protein C0404_11665 [Verrucomicrobia bacterium]|nr:hypothetical protein [Verrucomicrobiota bacterium]